MFDSKDWDLLLLRSIVPKLAWALQDALDINPLQQDLDPFNWVLAWHPVMPAHHMVNLLEFRFFPKWHQVSGCMFQLAVRFWACTIKGACVCLPDEGTVTVFEPLQDGATAA